MRHPSPTFHDPEIDPGELLRFLAREKWLIVALVLVVTGCAAGYAWLTTPIYRAEALVKPAELQDAGGAAGSIGPLSGLSALSGLNLGARGRQTGTALATLDSHAFLSRFIEEGQLLPILFAGLWDADRKAWSSELDGEPPTLWQGVQRFRRILHVVRDEENGLVTVAIEWKDRDLAARWANLLVERLNRHLRADAIRDTRRSIAFLDRELADTSNVDLRAAIGRLLERQYEEIMLMNVQEDYAFKVIDPAVAPPAGKSVKPNRKVILAFGILLGTLLGVLAAVTHAFVAAALRPEAAVSGEGTTGDDAAGAPAEGGRPGPV